MKVSIGHGTSDSSLVAADADSDTEGVSFIAHGAAVEGAYYSSTFSDEVPDIWRDLGDEEEVIGGMKLFCADLKTD